MTMLTQVVTYMNHRWIESRLGHKIWLANAPAIYVHRRVLYGYVSWKAACFIEITAPALELVALPRSGEPHIGRAVSSVGVMYRVSGPNTKSNPGGGGIQKKKKKNFCIFSALCADYTAFLPPIFWMPMIWLVSLTLIFNNLSQIDYWMKRKWCNMRLAPSFSAL